MKKIISKIALTMAFTALFVAAMIATASKAYPDEIPMEKPEFNAQIKVTSGTKKVQNQTIETDQDGLNAIFAHGSETVIDVSNVKISTKQNGSRGLYAAFGGTINAKNVEVSTLGEHCAAFATDMGEGNVSVTNGKAETSGRGSPVLYCTGNISAKNLAGKANASEIAVIEGKNSLSIEKSTLTGGAGLDGEVAAGIMIYQSMSGDANVGTAFLNVKNSNLTNNAAGPFIYATNTKGVVSLENTKITNSSRILLLVSGNNSERGWGRKGRNGAELELNAQKHNLEGEIQVDKISSLKLNLKDKSSFKGFVDAAKNGNASINLSKKAKFELTADSYFDKFNDSDESFKNIKSNGHTIFYNKQNSENSYLGGKTILLSDGGKIAPTEYEKVEIKADSDSDENRPLPPEMNGKAPNAPKGEMPELTAKSGTIQIVKNKAVLIESETKTTILKVMEDKGKNGNPPKKPDENGFKFEMKDVNSGNPPMNGGQMNGNPPAPPSGNRPEKPDLAKNQNGSRPKPVTFDDLKKLSGKQVQVKGIQESDGSFTVFEVTEKK